MKKTMKRIFALFVLVSLVLIVMSCIHTVDLNSISGFPGNQKGDQSEYATVTVSAINSKQAEIAFGNMKGATPYYMPKDLFQSQKFYFQVFLLTILPAKKIDFFLESAQLIAEDANKKALFVDKNALKQFWAKSVSSKDQLDGIYQKIDSSYITDEPVSISGQRKFLFLFLSGYKIEQMKHFIVVLKLKYNSEQFTQTFDFPGVPEE